MLRCRFKWRSGRRHRTGAAGRCPGRARLRIGPGRRTGASRQAAPRFSVSGEIADPVPGSAANDKRISAEGECEPVFFTTAAQWFSTVRWLINAGPAAREPHRPVADVVLPYAVKSYREALHCCDDWLFPTLLSSEPGRCSPKTGVSTTPCLLLTPWSRGRHASIFAHAAANPPSRPHRPRC